MLVVPIINKSGRKHIPYLVLCLIAINAFVYFFLQIDDHRLQSEAMSYYQKSGLLQTELSAYKKYLKEKHISSAIVVENSSELTRAMFDDNRFRQQLENNLIISKEDTGYKDWRGKRDQYELKLNRIVSHRFGYSPVHNNRIALFTSMFLHGSLMHLVGNMIFLYLVGALLELAVGPFRFLTGYLITGVCATWLFGFIYPLSPGPLVGASGAIAGLMGAYTVLFWMRKITIFYSLGFYFDYAKVPAIGLLPFWLGNEFFQLSFNQGSNVAYVAHIGGLVSGSLLATCYKLIKKGGVEKVFQEDEEKDLVSRHLEKGLEKMSQLEFEKARHEFQAILAVQPDNRTVMRHLFNMAKTDPESKHFHAITAKLLGSMTQGEDQQFIQIYEEYKNICTQPQLSSSILFRLTRISLGKKMYREAEGYLANIMKKDGNAPNLPLLIMRLAEGYNASGNKKKARTCLNLLARRFPESEAGEKAKEILNSFSGSG